LVDYLFLVEKKRELRGIYAYAVTNHPFTQKSMIKFQFIDCGLLLATSPASWKFKGISEGASQRISVVLSFKYMSPPAQYDLYVPEHHAAMVRKLYSTMGASHNFIVPSNAEVKYEFPESVLKTGVNDLESCAEIFVAEYGADILHQLRKTLRSYCVQQISAINLFLKMTDPLTYTLTAEFEKMGFFFAGILPESRIGDALVLQYLNNVDLDYDKIVLVSELSKELMDYIRDCDPNVII
jgi:serine/threonine-protein kinase RsbW